MSNYLADLERKSINAMDQTMNIYCQSRLSSNTFPDSVWKPITMETYLKAVSTGGYGGIIEVRKINEYGEILT